jgi:hypothetical protein
MAEVDRSAYNDIMQAYENSIGKMIIEEAERLNLKKIEAYIVLENVLHIFKEEVRKERNKRVD